MATPLTPTVSISSDVNLMTCNCCGSQDATVRQLSFQWRDPGPRPLAGGSTVVSLCRSCRALTTRALAADDESGSVPVVAPPGAFRDAGLPLGTVRDAGLRIERIVGTDFRVNRYGSDPALFATWTVRMRVSEVSHHRVDPDHVGSLDVGPLDEGSDARLFSDRAPQVRACSRCSGSGYLVLPYWLAPWPVPLAGAPPDSIWATTVGSAHIREATLEASELARRANRPVAFDFNDLLVVVRPHDDPEEVWRSWWMAKHGETPEQTAARR